MIGLGVILWPLLGWQFMPAEWRGGHDPGTMIVPGETSIARLRDPRALPAMAATFAMDWRMLRKDLAVGS